MYLGSISMLYLHSTNDSMTYHERALWWYRWWHGVGMMQSYQDFQKSWNFSEVDELPGQDTATHVILLYYKTALVLGPMRLTANLVSKDSKRAHPKDNSNNLHVVWCAGHIDSASLVKTPAVRVLVREDLLDVSNGENEVCLAEHSHSWDEPAHDPSLQKEGYQAYIIWEDQICWQFIARCYRYQKIHLKGRMGVLENHDSALTD